MSGTSMAAPHVAGVLALMRARDPGATAAQLKAQLLGTVDARAALTGKALTAGRLNAAAAVGAPGGDPDAPAPVSGSATATGGGTAAAGSAVATPRGAPSAPAGATAALRLGGAELEAGALTARRGLALRYTLDAAATVQVTVRRRRGARLARTAAATITLTGRRGTNRYVLRKRVGGASLARGSYRVTVQARAGTRRSEAVVLRLEVR
jgi:subtilisin family serine protease